MKNVLYIGSGAPWVGGAGYLVRQRMFLRALADTSNLHLALFDLPADAPPPPFDCKITPLQLIHLPPRGKLLRALADLVNPLPRMLRDVNLRASHFSAASHNTFDAVFAYRIDFAHFAGVLSHPRLLLDVDDPEHIRWRRRAESSGIPIDWRTERDLQKLQRFEINAVRRATHAFVCQDHDRKLFPSPNVTIIPNGVEIPPPSPPRSTPPTLLFLGNFAAGEGSPNTDALHWFTQSIWPLIHAQCPTAQCHIVGKMPPSLQEKLATLPNVHPLGFVATLADAFASARLSIAPLRFGTGTRIKILDSFAHACPVVSTPIGADGLDITPNQNILIADTPAAFATHCTTLLTNQPLAQQLGANSYTLAAQTYNTHQIESSLHPILNSLIQ